MPQRGVLSKLHAPHSAGRIACAGRSAGRNCGIHGCNIGVGQAYLQRAEIFVEPRASSRAGDGHHILAPRLNDPRATRRVRVWCAGCSSGEEPYSLAMTIRETIPDAGRWDIRILATDLDSDVLGRGQRGVYPAERLRDMSPARVSRFFRETTLNGQPAYTAAPELRDLITFKQLNLMTPFPMKGPLDAIFCRNVVIYFDEPTQMKIWSRFAELMPEGGHLYIGHSERVSGDSKHVFDNIGITTYRYTTKGLGRKG